MTQSTASRPAVESPGFVDSGIPGVRFKPVAHEVKKKTKELLAQTPDLHKDYNALSRTIRIINRAEHGPLKDRPYLGVFDGQQWPDEVDPHDRETWLQPGTYMDVPKEVAFHLVGNLWDATLPDKRDIINRHGGPIYGKPAGGKANPGAAPMQIVGMPKLPDLVVIEVNTRGKMVGEPKFMYELYTRGMTIGDRDPDINTPDLEDE